jgi:hypothetical protein
MPGESGIVLRELPRRCRYHRGRLALSGRDQRKDRCGDTVPRFATVHHASAIFYLSKFLTYGMFDRRCDELPVGPRLLRRGVGPLPQQHLVSPSAGRPPEQHEECCRLRVRVPFSSFILNDQIANLRPSVICPL